MKTKENKYIPGSPGESGLVLRGSQGLRSPLESRRGSLGGPERPQGSTELNVFSCSK